MWHGAHGMVWLNYFEKATPYPPTFNRKPTVWHASASHPFLSVLNKKKSSSLHLRDTVWKVKPKCFRNGTQRLYFGLGLLTFYFGLRPRLHVWQSKRHSRNQKRFFVTFGSTRDTIKVHIFLIFSKRFTVCFTMVIKWSPGGESGRQLRSPPV